MKNMTCLEHETITMHFHVPAVILSHFGKIIYCIAYSRIKMRNIRAWREMHNRGIKLISALWKGERSRG